MAAKKIVRTETPDTEVAGSTQSAPVGAPKSMASAALKAAAAAIYKATNHKPVLENKKPMPSVSSGSMCIDDLVGGSMAADGSGPKCPGYPRRRITEIYGPESSGKTTAAIQAIAQIQKQGGSAMFLDFEHALDHQYSKRIGMSFEPDKLLLLTPTTMEEGWKMINIGIQAGVDLIVVDSVASMVPKSEMDKPPGDVAKIGAVAAAMSYTLPKVVAWLDSNEEKYRRNPLGTALVFLNQVRATISTGYGGGGDQGDNTSGGKALKFYACLRIKFTKIKAESVKKKDPMTGKERSYPYGNHTQVKLVKTKVDGKPGFSTDIFIRFNYGIDDYYSLIEAANTNKLIRKEGAYYEYVGVRYQGRDKLRKFFMENPKAFSELRTKVLKAIRDDAVDLRTEDEEEEDIIAAEFDADEGVESEGVSEEIESDDLED